MANIDIWIWVGVIVLSLILEFETMEVVSIWFAVGGFIALMLSALNLGLEIQVIAFIVVSAGLLLTLRRWAKNKLLSSNEPTNLDLIKAQKLKLLSPITKEENGTVKYNGVTWTAQSAEGEVLQEGEFVVVQEIKGNKLIVKKGE